MYNSDFKMNYRFKGSNRVVCNVVNAIIESGMKNYSITMDEFMDGVHRSALFSTDSPEDMDRVRLLRRALANKKDYEIGYGKK